MTRELQDICGYLYQLVELAFPGNGIPAVGGFIFLRLVCPCIVAPEKYNILSGTSPVQHANRIVSGPIASN